MKVKHTLPKYYKEIFACYGIFIRSLNGYTLRLNKEEEPYHFFDWFYTTGSVVEIHNGRSKGIGKILDPEDLAVLMTKKSDVYTKTIPRKSSSNSL